MSQTTGLVRGIRRWDLVALGINFVIGAGIFGLPAKVFSLSGPASLIAYAICAVAVLLIGLCFAEVSSHFTRTGGPYLFATEAFGAFAGFEVGWLRWLAGVSSFAANSNLFVDYLFYLWPAANGSWARALVITTAVLSITVINVIGVRDTAVASNVLAIGKLIPLLIFIAIGLFFVEPLNFAMTARPGYSAMSMSVLLLMYAFSSFESVTILAGETQDPQRTVPFSLFVTIGIVTAVYVLIQVVCIGTFPELAGSTKPLAEASSRFLGGAGASLIAVGALVSMAGNFNANLLSNSRLLFVMAEDRHLPRFFAAIQPRFRTPYISILFCAAVVLGMALSGTFIQLVAVSVIARIAMYAFTCAALPVLRRKRNLSTAGFRAPMGPLLATVSVALCLWMLSNSTRGEALTATIAAAAGSLIYFSYKVGTRRGSHQDTLSSSPKED